MYLQCREINNKLDRSITCLLRLYLAATQWLIALTSVNYQGSSRGRAKYCASINLIDTISAYSIQPRKTIAFSLLRQML